MFNKTVGRFGIIATGVVAAITLSACHAGDSIAGAGSDTTRDVMGALVSLYNGAGEETTGGDLAFNVPEKLTGDDTFTVEGDSKPCGEVVYSASNPPPNGSSAGINALLNDTQGCIDFARSSRGRGSEPAKMEFYAFARDAVTWARFPNACPGGDVAPAGCAPINLTQTQLKGIYICDQPGGLPKFTNWAQVGGDNEPIRRYLPQTGSGTLSFFETRILGLSSSQQGIADDTACTTRPTRVQENDGSAIGTGNRAFSIVPYSFAQWTAQANGVVTDVRAGALLGRINNVAPTTTTITNGTFLGVRYVYNVAKTDSPSYARAVNFMGVRTAADGGNGFLCSNNADVQAAIAEYGFVPLTLASAGSGLPTSRCRKNPAPL